MDPYRDPAPGTVAEPSPIVEAVPQPTHSSEVTNMPDVTKEDLLALIAAVLATITAFGVDLTGEQLAALTALAAAVVVILPLAGAKRRAARVQLVNDRESRAFHARQQSGARGLEEMGLDASGRPINQ